MRTNHGEDQPAVPDDESVLSSDLVAGGPLVDTRAVIDSLPRAVVVSDPDGRILLWSQGAERLYGWEESEVLGRSVLELFLPIDGQAENATLLANTALGQPWQGDRVVLRRDGEPIRIMAAAHPMRDGAGRVYAIVATSEDVTELRIAQQRANDVSEHLHLALEAGGLGTWRWDMATGETVWDDRLQELFGVAATGFRGTYDAYVELLHPDDREEVLRTVETRSPRRAPTASITASDGRTGRCTGWPAPGRSRSTRTARSPERSAA